MVIGGLQRFSLIDFPGRISAIVFTQGCNLRCRYCHNPELVDPASYCDSLSEREVLRFLQSRTGRVQGLVITGGEPTIHPDLPRFCREVRALGYQIKLDTNGTNPDLLESMIADGLVDYLAVDVKGPPSAFARIAGRPHEDVSSQEKIQQSVARVLNTVFLTSFERRTRPGFSQRMSLGASRTWSADAAACTCSLSGPPRPWILRWLA